MENIKAFFQTKFGKIFAVLTVLIVGVTLFLDKKKDMFRGKTWLKWVLFALPLLIFALKDKIKDKFNID